jgi:hypothetical protein
MFFLKHVVNICSSHKQEKNGTEVSENKNKNFSLEHILKSAGEVSIVGNYGKLCLVD